MTLLRNLAVLPLAVVCLGGSTEALCLGQYGFTETRVIDRSYGSENATSYRSAYHPARINAARQTAIRYRSLSVSDIPAIAELSSTNARLVDQWVELADVINARATHVIEAKTKLEAASRDYQDVDSKLQLYGLTPTVGLLLSHKRSQLDDWQIDGSIGHRLSDEIQRSREKQLELDLVEYDGSDVARQSSEILAAAGYDSTHIQYASLVASVQNLLRERHEWLQLLTQGSNDYRHKLSELNSASLAFEKLTDDFRTLISRHVTWIRSNDPLGIADFRKFSTGLGALFNSRRSADFGYSLQQKWNSNPSSGLVLLAQVLILLLLRILTKSWLLGIGKRKRLREATTNVRKLAASLLTPLVAIAFPSILYSIARWLGTGYVSESTLHVSSGLYAASFVALVIEMPRQLLRKHGFVEKHLRIEIPRQQRASVYLLVTGTGLMLSAYVTTLAEHIDHGTWSGSVARLGFIASLLLVGWTIHLALKPKGGLLEPIVERFGGSLLHRIRFLFYVLGVGFSAAMIGLSALGYGFTATVIIQRAGIMLVAMLVGATLWSAIKILSSGLWHRITNGAEDSQDSPGQPTRLTGTLAAHSLELKHQIAFLSQCALVLATIAGCCWLWIDVFPNVRLGNPVVWTVQETVTQAIVDAGGQKVNRSELQTTPITALHLILALATLFVAFQLAKLLPAIFDTLVLQRVNFDEAMEHLSLVFGRCLLFGTGCFIACKLIGLRWEAIQWLAVGLTIGLGFALQDIVRNLFGGLVVLFEKPAKLGDLITVGNVTGRVAAQKLRTTVLSDQEGREVIIPNKNFVSQDVVNWMGAGRLKAILLEVAVTRDERPADICRKLQQLLVEQPDVLLNPAPQATLICVSREYQRIELRAWIEEHQDVNLCRESLTKIVLNFLAENELRASHQPRQPIQSNSIDPLASRNMHSRKRRSA